MHFTEVSKSLRHKHMMRYVERRQNVIRHRQQAIHVETDLQYRLKIELIAAATALQTLESR
jgi:hypothetical protein